MNPLYGALFLNISYLSFRWFAMHFHWFEPGDFLWKMPVFPILVALPVLQIFAVQRFLTRLERGEATQNSFFATYKDAAKVGLLASVLISASIWLYYSFIDKTYLPAVVLQAISEAATDGLPAEQLKSYGQTISTFNQPNLRAVFTLSGLTVFGMLSAWPAALFSMQLKHRFFSAASNSNP